MSGEMIDKKGFVARFYDGFNTMSDEAFKCACEFYCFNNFEVNMGKNEIESLIEENSEKLQEFIYLTSKGVFEVLSANEELLRGLSLSFMEKFGLNLCSSVFFMACFVHGLKIQILEQELKQAKRYKGARCMPKEDLERMVKQGLDPQKIDSYESMAEELCSKIKIKTAEEVEEDANK